MHESQPSEGQEKLWADTGLKEVLSAAVCVSACICAYVHTCVHMCIVCMYTCVYLCLPVCICMLYMCVNKKYQT